MKKIYSRSPKEIFCKSFSTLLLFSFISITKQSRTQMVYVSSTVTQPNTNSILKGSTDVEMIRVEVITSGSSSPLSLTSMRFTRVGTTNISNDVVQCGYKVRFGGTNPAFSSASVAGTACAFDNTAANPFTVSITGVTLQEGTNYFWLTINLNAGAANCNRLDAQCISMVVSGSTKTPTVTDPAGYRPVDQNMGLQSIRADLSLASPVLTGSTDNPVIKVEIRVLGSLNPFTVDRLTFNTNGTTIFTNSSDIQNAKVFYTGYSSTFSNIAQFGSTISSPGGNMVFSGSQPLSVPGPNLTCPVTLYFWLTYDIPPSATVCNGVDASCTEVKFTSGTNVPSLTAPGKGRMIGTNCPLQVKWDKTFSGNFSDYVYTVTQSNDGGFLLGGASSSGISGNKTLASYGQFDYWVVKTDANGVKQWDNVFGGTGDDYLFSIAKTSDGGFVLGGYSMSFNNGNKTSTNYGGKDFWVVKIDANGTKQWEAVYGGGNDDHLEEIKQTTDGGYIMSGYSFSGVSGNKTTTNQKAGGCDLWVVRADVSGNKLWETDFGGPAGGADLGMQIEENANGFIVAGQSSSGIGGNKTSPNKGDYDYWVIQMDPNGNKLWEAGFGGSGEERLYGMTKTSDGAVVLAGYSWSGISGDKTQVNYGSMDYWIVKVSSAGILLWEKTFGSSGGDTPYDIIETADGGLVTGGQSTGDISGDKTIVNWENPGGTDFWVLKISGAGVKLWDRNYGSSGNEWNTNGWGDLLQTSDGGFVFVISSNGTGDGEKSQPAPFSNNDFWMIRVSAEGPVATPVKWESISAEYRNGEVLVKWRIASEWGNDYFEVQRSTDGKFFETIGSRDGVKDIFSYTFSDETPEPGNNYYRILQVDLNGTFSYSNTAEAFVYSGIEFSAGEIFPVPSGERASVRLYVRHEKTKTEFNILDVTGRKVLHESVLFEKGAHTKTFSLNDFCAGTYFLEINSPSGKDIRRFIKQ